MLPADTTALSAGRWLGPYRILARIGQGGTASVYAAELRDAPPGVDARVALKVADAADPAAGDGVRFEREAAALGELRHPNVVRVLGSGRDGAYAWLAMELIEGPDLEELLARWRADPSPE
ncbi:MAG TPA: protein kinase, partial [Myxococcota bacterium]|nr:protein kinase [Myxococcota bacterium]